MLLKMVQREVAKGHTDSRLAWLCKGWLLITDHSPQIEELMVSRELVLVRLEAWGVTLFEEINLLERPEVRVVQKYSALRT